MSGFTGSAGALIITSSRALLVTDFRYIEQAAAQASEFEVIKQGAVLTDSLRQALEEVGVRRLAFEKEFVSYGDYERYRDKLGAELVPMDGAVEKLRLVKDSGEIEAIRRAAAIGDKAFRHILDFLRPGLREDEVSLELEFQMRRLGATGLAFDIIVASGPRSSLPHGRASERVIQPGDFVKMDFGCVVDGYCSDMTRTVVMGEPSEKQREIYDIVLEAQVTSLKAIRPGLTGREVDEVARKVIADRGYGDHFGHGLGHGVGRMVHEGPRLSVLGEDPLVPGNVVTIEPGIYLPGWGGVRIEDLVVVTEVGVDVLTGSPKDLIIL
jgi:Xaa-Pro aminopeptidase